MSRSRASPAGSTPPSPADLLRGDRRAWLDFVTAYEGLVAGVVIGMIGPGPEADEVGQDVFVRFHKHVSTFRGEADVSTYLTRTAINLSLNVLKRRGRMRRWFHGEPDPETPSEDVRPDHAVEQRELAHEVSLAIRSLAPPQRAVVVLRLVQDFTTAETARLLQIPEGTVMSRLARAQKTLRKLLTPVLEESHA